MLLTSRFNQKNTQQIPTPATSSIRPTSSQVQTGTQSITTLPDEDNTPPLLIDPEKAGVQNATVYYTVSGIVQELQKSNDAYVITLTSASGESLLTGFTFDPNTVKVEQIQDSGESIPLLLSDIHKGDTIDVNITGNLITNSFGISFIYKHTK